MVVDCTLGLGGHSAGLLEHLGPGGRLIAIDFDPLNIRQARPVLERVGKHAGATFDIFHNNFAALPTVLIEAGVEKVDAILADIGVASTQIDDAERGFSYRRAGPLDMRMDPTRGTPASVLVNRLTADELAEAFWEFGDEEDAAKIAELIVNRRVESPIETTEALTAIICEARDFTLQRAAGAKLHPAARTFQALRILVNREMANLERLLKVAPDHLNLGGVLAIISFHSGEDRRVKHAMKAGLKDGVWSEGSDGPIVATEEEKKYNPRSGPAKLRWVRRS